MEIISFVISIASFLAVIGLLMSIKSLNKKLAEYLKLKAATDNKSWDRIKERFEGMQRKLNSQFGVIKTLQKKGKSSLTDSLKKGFTGMKKNQKVIQANQGKIYEYIQKTQQVKMIRSPNEATKTDDTNIPLEQAFPFKVPNDIKVTVEGGDTQKPPEFKS